MVGRYTGSDNLPRFLLLIPGPKASFKLWVRGY